MTTTKRLCNWITGTYDVFGILRRSQASRKSVLSRCREDHLCKAVQWQFHSSTSNISCRMFRGQIYRKANRNVQHRSADSLDVYHRNNLHAMDNRNLRLHRDAFPRRPDRSDSRKAPDVRSHTPSNDRSNLCHSQHELSSGTGPLAVVSGHGVLQNDD